MIIKLSYNVLTACGHLLFSQYSYPHRLPIELVHGKPMGNKTLRIIITEFLSHTVPIDLL